MQRLRERRPPASDRGFTLIELLIVIVILAILSGIAIIAVSAFRQNASGAGYDEDRRNLETAIAGYYGRNNAYPADLDALVTAGYLTNASISVDKLHLVGDGYTIEFTPGSPPTLSDKPTSLAAGGTPVTPGGGGGGGASPSPSPTGGAPTATTMTATVATGARTSLGCNGGGNNCSAWRVVMSINVTDNLGAAVDGAAVTGTWSSSNATGTPGLTCTTTAGSCSVTSGDFDKVVASVTFTVTNVSRSGLTWSHPTSPAATANRPF